MYQLFVVSGSIKNLLSIDYAHIFFNIFLVDFARWKVLGYPTIAYVVIH